MTSITRGKKKKKKTMGELIILVLGRRTKNQMRNDDSWFFEPYKIYVELDLTSWSSPFSV